MAAVRPSCALIWRMFGKVMALHIEATRETHMESGFIARKWKIIEQCRGDAEYCPVKTKNLKNTFSFHTHPDDPTEPSFEFAWEREPVPSPEDMLFWERQGVKLTCVGVERGDVHCFHSPEWFEPICKKRLVREP